MTETRVPVSNLPTHPRPSKPFLTLEMNKGQDTTSGGSVGDDEVMSKRLGQSTAPAAIRYSRLGLALLTSRALSHDCRLPEPGGAAHPAPSSRLSWELPESPRPQRHTLPRRASHPLPTTKKFSQKYSTIIAVVTRRRHGKRQK